MSDDDDDVSIKKKNAEGGGKSQIEEKETKSHLDLVHVVVSIFRLQLVVVSCCCFDRTDVEYLT